MKWSPDRVVLTTGQADKAKLIMQRYHRKLVRHWANCCGAVSSLSLAGCETVVTVEAVAEETSTEKTLPAAALDFRGPALRETPPSATEERREPEDIKSLEERVRTTVGRGGLQPSMTLERFCVSDSNRGAYRAIDRLLSKKTPSVTYIHAGYGLGKTHLLNAAAIEWLRRYPTSRVMFLQYDSLVADVSTACLSSTTKELKEYLQDTDLLILDDVHQLRGRDRSQEELVCVMDRLQQTGKFVLIAGALSPLELAQTGIVHRLTERLSGGATAEIDRPDFALRVAVAEQLSKELGARSRTVLPTRHLELIARRCDRSIREVEGAMFSLDLALEGDKPLDDKHVTDAIVKITHSRRPPTSLESIMAAVVEVFGVSRLELVGKRRFKPIVRARHAFCLVAKMRTNASLKAIAKCLDRDHTTVINSIEKAQIIGERDEEFAARLTQLLDQFEEE